MVPREQRTTIEPLPSMRLRPLTFLENSLEFAVERPFAMLFRRSIQPAEIGKRLKRELTSGGIVSVRGRVAPNDFTVLLHREDFAPYQEHGQLLSEDLAAWLDEIALSENLVMTDGAQVRFQVGEAVRRGRFEIRSAVAAASPPPAIVHKHDLTEAFAIETVQPTSPFGYVEVCSGAAIGTVFPVRKQIVTIGRDLSNDLVIDSAEVSRFHAELHATAWRLSVLDRNSLNGTFVNGIRISVGHQMVEPGDQIIFGTTICRFWRELL